METPTKSKGRGMVSGQDRSSSGAYPVFWAVAEVCQVVQSRVDADEVTGRHDDATVGNIYLPPHEIDVSHTELKCHDNLHSIYK